MIRTTVTLFALGSFLVLVPACGGDDVGEKYPSVESFCAQLAADECSAVALGCQATVEACKPKRSQTCQAAAATRLGQGRTYRAPVAEGCLNRTKELLSGRVIDPTKEAETNDACERVFAGSKDKSAPCASNYECSGNQICDKGVCADKVERKQGDGCSNAGEVCAKGSYCRLEGQLRFCRPKKSTNEVCTAEEPCLEELRCAGSATSGSCQPKFTVGQVCLSAQDCATGTTCVLQSGANVCLATSLPQGRTCKDDYGGQ